jgi:hypothetical protein
MPAASFIPFTHEDVQHFFDIQIINGLGREESIARTAKKFGLDDLQVGPVGIVHSDELAEFEEEQKIANQPEAPEQGAEGGEGGNDDEFADAPKPPANSVKAPTSVKE